VVVSANAVNSKWVTKEITTFETEKPGGLIVPLLLDGTSMNSIVDGLADHQAINFVTCMRTGFEKLLAIFNKEFLSKEDRRNPASRRQQEDRREGKERRQSSITQRMRKGFWKSYALTRGAGEFDVVRMLVSECYHTLDALEYEASKYKFVDEKGIEHESKEALEQAVLEVWEMFRLRDAPKSVFVVEAIAETLCERYKVSAVDTRRQAARRAGHDRRDID
jgi:hypothetical protein